MQTFNEVNTDWKAHTAAVTDNLYCIYTHILYCTLYIYYVYYYIVLYFTYMYLQTLKEMLKKWYYYYNFISGTMFECKLIRVGGGGYKFKR